MSSKPARTNWREARRFRELELKRDGWTHDEVARALSVSKTAVSKWVKIAQEQGDDGLLANPRKGAKPRLTPEQLQWLPELLKAGEEAYGFRGGFWTCERGANVIEWEFNVTYHKAHVSRILKCIDWTPQRPIERATQRDEAAITRWRSEVWPALNKKLATKGVSSFVLMRLDSTCCPVRYERLRHVARRRSSGSFKRAIICRS